MSDLLLHGALVVTMDDERSVIRDGAVRIRGPVIDAVGGAKALLAEGATTTVDLGGLILMPGLVDGHVHLTGPSLFPGIEPDESPLPDHFPRWVMPAHVHSEAEDEAAAARMTVVQMLRRGTTAFLEAGVCRYPKAVLEGLASLPIRGAIGVWAADEWPLPRGLATTTDEAIDRLDDALRLEVSGARVEVRPSLIGHTGCSDELMRAAADRARTLGRTWTFHMSAYADDSEAFRARTGRAPLVHLREIGVLDQLAVVGHGIHLCDEEVSALASSGATVAYCPGASARLATGVVRVGRHDELERVALGTDTQNASNHLDLLRSASLACSLYAERRGSRSVTAAAALGWATRGGARALGWADRIGSIEPGKRADLIALDPLQQVRNVEVALVHGAPRVLHVWVSGESAVIDGHIAGDREIEHQAAKAASRVAERAGLPASTGWMALS